MYFEIEGSSVCLAGTMHRVPKGLPLAHWVNDAISWARVIYLEHDKQESDRCRYAPPGSQPLAKRLPHSWPRIERKYPFDRFRVEYLSRLRPFSVASDVLDQVPTDEGVEQVAIARSKVNHPPGPRTEYLETAAQSYALADGVSDAIWDDAVCWALDNPASSKQVLESSYAAWIAGDFEEVDRIGTLHSRNRFEPIKHAVITARNYLWLPTIRDLVRSASEPTLVLVGAAHLGGPDGLVPQVVACGLRLAVAGGQ
jgi:uncharacterized protein YbaP (TraB family)